MLPRSASRFVERFGPLVRPGGAVLDLACGAGRHVRWFRERGYPVTAVDRDLAGIADLAGVEKIRTDLEDGSPWPLSDRRFAAVVVTNYLHRPLFPLILGAVADGGLLIYETFARGNEAFGRPRNPDFLLEKGELIEVVSRSPIPFDVLGFQQGFVERPKPAVVQRICAERGSLLDGSL